MPRTGVPATSTAELRSTMWQTMRRALRGQPPWPRSLLERPSLYTNTGYLIAANVVNAALGFLFCTAAARLYRPQDVGVAAAALSGVGLLGTLSTLGLDYAVVAFLPRAPHAWTIINSSLTLEAAAGLLLGFGFVGIWAPVLAPLAHSALFVCGLVLAVMLTSTTSFLNNVMLVRDRGIFVLALSLIFGVVKLFFVVTFAFVPQVATLFGAWALGLVATVLCAVGFFVPRVEGGDYRPHLSMSWETIAQMVRFALANYVATILWTAPTFLLPLLILALAGPEATGYFYVAWHVSGLVSMVPTAVALSVFARGSCDSTHLIEDAITGGRLALWLLLPIVAAMFLLGGRVLLLFGARYSAHATAMLWLLAMSAVPMTVNSLSFSVNRVRGRMSGVVAGMLWILVITLGLSSVLTPRIGLQGVGISWLVAQTSLAIVVLAVFVDRRRGRTHRGRPVLRRDSPASVVPTDRS